MEDGVRKVHQLLTAMDQQILLLAKMQLLVVQGVVEQVCPGVQALIAVYHPEVLVLPEARDQTEPHVKRVVDCGASQPILLTAIGDQILPLVNQIHNQGLQQVVLQTNITVDQKTCANHREAVAGTISHHYQKPAVIQICIIAVSPITVYR